MECDDCKYADWKRTSNGRLHPSGEGRCTVAKKVPIPPSARDLFFYLRNVIENGVLTIEGGNIERGETLKDKCAYYGK